MVFSEFAASSGVLPVTEFASGGPDHPPPLTEMGLLDGSVSPDPPQVRWSQASYLLDGAIGTQLDNVGAAIPPSAKVPQPVSPPSSLSLQPSMAQNLVSPDPPPWPK